VEALRLLSPRLLCELGCDFFRHTRVRIRADPSGRTSRSNRRRNEGRRVRICLEGEYGHRHVVLGDRRRIGGLQGLTSKLASELGNSRRCVGDDRSRR
jgi:hypothetical protein